MTHTETNEAIFEPPVIANGLKKIPPYWYPYTTMAKGRWLGREILEVVSTEFRDRSMEYYRYALESGVTTINGKVAQPDTVVHNGDRIENVVHRHEPPVTSSPVQVLHHDKGREFIVINKPGSIPVHPTGRYFKNSLIEILQDEFGYEKVYPVNRLDRLTSGLMILGLTSKRASELTKEFVAGTIRKEYIARCKGEFPEEEVICEEPLLTVDRQMGLNIVHPEGKPAKTIFKRLRYDANTDSSILHCQPLTGRSHQIRVHLQYLGHSIANDNIYSETRIWGDSLGKGGIDIVPSEERSAPAPPEHLHAELTDNPESSMSKTAKPPAEGAKGEPETTRKLLPRETGHDIGMGSPIPLSKQAVEVISRLRNMKDEDEDWGRWRDVVFKAKGAISPKVIVHAPLPPQNKRKRGGPGNMAPAPAAPHGNARGKHTDSHEGGTSQPASEIEINNVEAESPATDVPTQLTTEGALARLTILDSTSSSSSKRTTDSVHTEDVRYCSECYIPLHPDPKPEKLYIFLHALRYTTSLGCFETEMPEWASEGWAWDRS